jgi:hypothetical protein
MLNKLLNETTLTDASFAKIAVDREVPAEALMAGLQSAVRSLEDLLARTPDGDHRLLVPDLLRLEDRIMNLVVKARRREREEELDAMLEREGY